MNYLRNLFLNFLIVFIANRFVPGLVITYFDQVPNVAASIFFSILVALFNTSVYPFLRIMEIKPTLFKIAIPTGIISFGAFILIAIIPFGVIAESPMGVFLGGLLVWAVAFLTNYYEFRKSIPK